jgi:hypothetical protein
MALPDTTGGIVQVQYEFYKSAGRLAKLWYALTVIGLIMWILSFVLICVGGILTAGSIIPIINSLMSNYPAY